MRPPAALWRCEPDDLADLTQVLRAYTSLPHARVDRVPAPPRQLTPLEAALTPHPARRPQ